MTAETTRRGFLGGLLGTLVICALPRNTAAALIEPDFDPFSIVAPPDKVFQWVRTHVMGEPEPKALAARLQNGWKFVSPTSYPRAPVTRLKDAIAKSGLVLMEKPKAAVEAQERQRRVEGSCARGYHFWQPVADSDDRECYWCKIKQVSYADYVPQDPKDD